MCIFEYRMSNWQIRIFSYVDGRPDLCFGVYYKVRALQSDEAS